MENNYLAIKISKDRTDLTDYLKDSYNTKSVRFYNVKDTDKSLLTDYINHEFKVVFIIFDNNFRDDKVLQLYLGQGTINDQQNLVYTAYGMTDSKLLIKNFMMSSGLNLNDDYKSHSYLSIESFSDLYRQLELSIIPPLDVHTLEKADLTYQDISIENDLHDLSQKNSNCLRPLKICYSKSNRGEFQRDRERVVHSRASRRLVDKAQIFTSSKGDHYRTRMTHTLEVSQIARGIAQELNMNLDLTEAIALAHDIGHTPFGHQGERTLQEILSGKLDVIHQVKDFKFGGFKHNYQGLRVLTSLEEKYLEHDGLNLSYQVLEGILKHTKTNNQNCHACPNETCNKKCFNIDEFLTYGDADKLYPEYKFSTTLEGQIVAISDEIAQRGHDLDDAFSAKHLDLDSLKKYSEIKKMKSIYEIIEKTERDLESLRLQNRIYSDPNDILRARLVPKIMAYFIKDVIDQSNHNIENFQPTPLFEKDKRFENKLIDFSNEGKFVVEYLETIISKRVINSYEVTLFDDKARNIIIELFRIYYNNPKLLPKSVLNKLYKDLRMITTNVINFNDSDPGLIREELSYICFEDVPVEDGTDTLDENHILYKKRKILVRTITDYIAGMTDNYAINKFQELSLKNNF